MNWVDIIADRRAADAASNGTLSNLPGEGAPLNLSEDLLVPPDVRALMRTLKHAGFTPPEIAMMTEIADIEKELVALSQGGRADPVAVERVERVEKAKALMARITLLRESQMAGKSSA